MERVVVTVEALRCWQCQKLMHPSEPFFRRQMLTAVETGSRIGEVHRYERVNVCADCHTFFEQVDAENRRRNRWWWIWFWAVIAAVIIPYGLLLLGGAIIWRNIWKWRTKRRPQRVLGRADLRKVPQAAAPRDGTSRLTLPKDGSV